MDKKKQVLGVVLAGSIWAARGMASAAPVPPVAPVVGEAIQQIPVGDIDPNPFQTRIQVDEQSLNELADSIKVQGVLQPIVLRKVADGKLQLVAGQRRWLASQRAGKDLFPAIVRQLSDEQAIELTIIENLQREDLNPLDQAAAFERLSSTCGLTQEQIAQRTGKDRATVANYMRLLRLPDEVRNHVRSGELTMGHAGADGTEQLRRARQRGQEGHQPCDVGPPDGNAGRQLERAKREEGKAGAGDRSQRQGCRTSANVSVKVLCHR